MVSFGGLQRCIKLDMTVVREILVRLRESPYVAETNAVIFMTMTRVLDEPTCEIPGPASAPLVPEKK